MLLNIDIESAYLGEIQINKIFIGEQVLYERYNKILRIEDNKVYYNETANGNAILIEENEKYYARSVV
jgi:hypothetical protein